MKIRVIENRYFPMKGFAAITIWPWIFCRRYLNDIDLNHELIHVKQQEEMLILPFFIWYVVEWLIRLIIYRKTWEAYRNICFEQEAYLNQRQASYIADRAHFSWIKYLTRKTFRRV